MALFFEDFTAGFEIVTSSRPITDVEVESFAELSGDRNPLHLDETYARTTIFGGRVAHGVLGLAVATGLLAETGLTRGTLVALVGIEWKFRAPIRLGDTVTARVRVRECRDLAGKDRGVVRLAVTLVNQHGEVVQEGDLTELIRKRTG